MNLINIDPDILSIEDACTLMSVYVQIEAKKFKKQAKVYYSNETISLIISDKPHINWAAGCGERIINVINILFKLKDESNFEFLHRILTKDLIHKFLNVEVGNESSN